MNGRSSRDMDRAAVVEYLRSLTLRERVELFNEELQEFQEMNVAADGTVLYRYAYLVANLTYGNFKSEPTPHQADIRPLALPEKGQWGHVSDAVTQSGICDYCGTESAGFSKSSVCPACGSSVDMT